ncbi:hypothetical protein RRSWK_06000 [Rhodopirellula sp. SWK7]|nr:hypothetical protein RRSWK_06000 [Rhodopirellula sp. SWK7]
MGQSVRSRQGVRAITNKSLLPKLRGDLDHHTHVKGSELMGSELVEATEVTSVDSKTVSFEGSETS